VVEALLRAARAGKAVVACVELSARFDEERNISWARQLEEAGARVTYGVAGLKKHAKAALVERREDGALRRYSHVSSGNYNARTARLYTDLSLLTADDAIGADLRTLFDELTGSPGPPEGPFQRCLVSPCFLLPALLDRIRREAEHARAGRGGRMRMKLNGLSDGELIRALYDASRAGVEIDLVVRGLCTLRPGVPGLSERIRVVSAVGRFLEHARIYHFANAGEPEYYIGSADWRPRNLRRRVEVVVPVSDPRCRERLAAVLDLELDDPAAWELGPHGGYVRRGATGEGVSAQETLLAAASAAAAAR
jgi:polyphosphate kinase